MRTRPQSRTTYMAYRGLNYILSHILTCKAKFYCLHMKVIMITYLYLHFKTMIIPLYSAIKDVANCLCF